MIKTTRIWEPDKSIVNVGPRASLFVNMKCVKDHQVHQMLLSHVEIMVVPREISRVARVKSQNI